MKHLTSFKLGIIALLTPFAQKAYSNTDYHAEVEISCEHKIEDARIVSAADQGSNMQAHESVKELLEQGIYVDSRNNGNMTALMKASSKGHLELARLLLSYGANPNAQSNSGKTPLIRSVLDCSDRRSNSRALALAENLIKYGANLNSQDNEGSTPLMYSTRLVMTPFFELLMEKKADVNILNNKDENALTYILNNLDNFRKGESGSHYYYQIQYVQKLIEKDADFNQADSSGETALMKLQHMGEHQLIQLCHSMEQEMQPAEVPELVPSNDVEQPNW